MSTDRSPTYYSRPVLKEPVWSPEVAIYFFTGGLAGASAVLAFFARLKHEANRAMQLSLVTREDARRAREHGGMRVMTARMHPAIEM